MENVLQKQNFNTKYMFSELQEVPHNPMFSHAKARILYEGFNRNNSYFTSEAIAKALPTLYGIPLVGEYNQETDNFGGHGGKLVIKGSEIEIEDTTMPYGYVSENAKVYWEAVTEADGTLNNYLVADPVVLWTGRYSQLNTMLEEGKFGQSMEIQVKDGQFEKIEDKETFNITDFVFSGLCILGVSKEDDEDGHVEPCFESASVETYNMLDENFKKQFNFMLEEYNSKTSTKKQGGNTVDFELTHQQLSAKLRKDLEGHRFTDQHGYNGRKYWYQDHTGTEVIYEDLEEGGQLYQSPYKVDGDSVTIDTADRTASKISFVPEKKGADFELLEKSLAEANDKVKEFEVANAELTATKKGLENQVAEFEASQGEESEAIVALKANHATAIEELETSLKEFKAEVETATEKAVNAEAELSTLREFKLNTEITAIKEKFANKLEADILEKIISDNSTQSVDAIEGLLFAEIGKQKFSIDTQVEPPFQSVPQPSHQTEVPTTYASALAAKYKK